MKPLTLRQVLGLVFSTLLLSPILVLVLSLQGFIVPALQSQTQESLRSSAIQLAYQVETLLADRQNSLLMIKRLLEVAPNQESQENLLSLVMKDSVTFGALYILSPQGILTSVGLPHENTIKQSNVHGLDLSLYNFNLTNGSKNQWSNTFLSAISGKMAVAFSVPMGEMTLIAEVNVEDLPKMILAPKIETQMLMILDGSFQVIAHTEPRYSGQQWNVSNLGLVQHRELDKWETFEFDGKKWYGGLITTQLSSWSVLVALPEDVAFRSLRALLFLILASTLISVLIILLGVLLVSYRVQVWLKGHLQQLETLGHQPEVVTPRPSKIFELNTLNSMIFKVASLIHSREVELEASESRYRGVFNAVGEGLFVHSGEDFRILQVNQTAERMFKLSKDELLSLPNIDAISSCISPYNSLTAMEKMQAALTKGIQVFEWQSKDSQGMVFWTEVSLTPVWIKDFHVVIASVRNIEDRKKAESEALHLQKMESIGFLAGGIAHDFNNILQAIMAYSELAILKNGRGQDNRDDLEGIRESAKRSGQLTSQLLLFARRGNQYPVTFELNQRIDALQSMLNRLLPKEISFTFKKSAQSLNVHMDPSQLDQVVVNLVVNARDAIEGKQGEIRIVTEILDDQDELSTEQSGQCAVIKIEDTGYGMDEITQGKVFEPFFTTKAEGKGTGLGLSTVFGIVKQNQGTIKISSVVGQGTTFTLLLPLVNLLE